MPHPVPLLFFVVRIWEPITIFQKFPLGGAPFLTFQIFKNLGFSIFKKRGNRYFFTDHHKLLERSRSSFGFGLPITIHRFLIISVLLEASRSFQKDSGSREKNYQTPNSLNIVKANFLKTWKGINRAPPSGGIGVVLDYGNWHEKNT